MKTRLAILLLCFFKFGTFVFAQAKESEKIGEFGLVQCGALTALVGGAFQEFERRQDAKFYVVYYEGKKLEHFVFNQKTRKYDRFTEPVRGYAVSKAQEITLYLNTVYKPKKGQVVLIDGGFREELLLELWTAPENAAPPKLMPTVSEKDMKFKKGKPPTVKNCARAYDGY